MQSADAVGRADRLRQGAQQCVRPEGVARAFPRGPPDRRCRSRPAVACGGGDGAWLRRRSAQHRCREGRRSRRDGARFRSGDRSGPFRLPGWPHGVARHGRALDARRRPGRALVSAIDPFYPIVVSAAWVGRLVGVGARFIQLRIKDATEDHLRSETHHALTICRRSGAELVVNDHWEVAIDAGAAWVHLGQGDLDEADILAVRKAGIRLGISTHDDAELVRALTFAPDYIALGPIYPTKLKAMAFAPQGLETIGGLDVQRAKLCLAAGADVVSVVTDITLNPDPEARTREWIAATRPA